MAKKYNGGIVLATGFKISDPQPVADYLVVELISDLTNPTTLPFQFTGMTTFVLEDQNAYVLKNTGWEKSGIVFTGGTVSGATNFIGGLTANTISATTYQNLPQLKNIITVAKSGGQFTSIKSAVDSISGSNYDNRYEVKIAPGVYLEYEIDLTNKPYVSIVGSSIESVAVEPNTTTQNLFKIGQNNELSFMTLNNVGSGYTAVYCDNIGDYAQAHKLSFNDCDINITVLSSTQDTKFFGEYIDFNGSYSYGVKIIASNGYLAYANMENYYNYPTGIGTTIANYVQGSGATLSVFVGDGIGNGVAGSTNYYILDYASLNTTTTTAEGWDYCVRNPNIGGPVRFDIDSLSVINSSTYDVSIEHLDTFGTFNGSSTHTKIHSVSENVYWSFLDSVDGEFEITKKMSVTFSDGTHTDMSTLIFQGGTMGLISGGTITASSGLTVNVGTGFGYLQNSGNPTIYQRIDWNLTSKILTSNSNLYLYFNETGGLFTSGGRPNTVNNIVIGRVVTNSTSVEFIDSSPTNADHTSNRYGNLFRSALGPIYSSGSIVTENTTPFKLNASSGEYYYSSNQYLPIGGSGFTFTQYYRNGLGGWNTSATTFVNNTQFDNDGVLSGLTASAFTKHTLYIVGSGVNEKYFLVLGQNQYPTLVETENALLPTPPTFFNDSVSQIANIYIKQGLSGITQVEDIRPVIGFKAGGVNASSLHANLLGLASDDHKQYLLVDGSRNMSGILNMGGNSIINTGTINNVTIQSHASRHKNGGDDEVATSTPGASEIPKADTFGKLDGWISDASSSVKGLTKLSVNPISATIPIAVGENDLRFQNSITGVTNTSGILSFSNVTGETTNFTGLTLSTISATTYQNLPATPFLPFSGGTVSGATIFTGGLTADTISATTYQNLPATPFLPLSGGTVSGATNFTNGLTANTISATTYQNLPTDIRVTGGTYSGSTIIFTNNTGGTFNVTGITTSSTFTGGTVSGATNFTNGLTANTISATTYQNLPATPFLPLSGGTVSGATIFTGSLTANTISATTITVNNISGTTRLIGLQTFQGTTDSDAPPLGPELTTTGTSDSSWTGTSFASGYTHIPGSTTTLVSPLTVSSGTYYSIICTITGRTAGTITIDFGGYSNGTLSASTIYYAPLATTTGALTVTPTTDFDGKITVSVKTIGTSLPSTKFINSLGGTAIEIRADKDGNTFIGNNSGRRNFGFNNQGIYNTFIGTSAGRNNTSGRFNTFIGMETGYNNNIGFSNTFIGNGAGYSNTYGNSNTFLGSSNGTNNTTGNNNAAIGSNSLNTNTTGNNNTAIGQNSLPVLLNQTNNVALGANSGMFLTTGNDNVLLGSNVARYISGGAVSATNISNSILIGTSAFPLGNSQTNQIAIGYFTTGLGSNTTVLGNSSTVTTAIYGNLLLGTTNTTGDTTTKLQVSGAPGTTSVKIVGSGNSTTAPIFTVQGSQGELFSVNDTLIGSLFSVNDISGLPVLEAFSDNTVLMGSYIAPSLNTTIKVIAVTGLTNIYSIPTSAYTGAFFDYTISNGTNLRAGNIMSIWNSGTTIQYRETSTNDIGNTSGLTFNMIVSGSTAILRTSGVTGNWTVKTIVRSI